MSLGMDWRPGLPRDLASRAAFGLILTALGLGRSRNLVLRRHRGTGGGHPAQGRRHDWVGDKGSRGLGGRRGIASVRDPSVRVSVAEKALSYRLAGPSSISGLLGNLLPAFLCAPMETVRVRHHCSHWLVLRRGGPNRGRSRVAPPHGGGGIFRVTCSSFFFSSSHPKPTGCSRVFQELSFAIVEPATPKMEAPCAAIKRKPSEL